jgi:salicylate hydroxylase
MGSHAEKSPLEVLIVGCGLGGLSCAIACKRGGLDVHILEKAAKIMPVGAGIQIPPNATKVLQHYGIEDALNEGGAVKVEGRHLRRYSDGKLLASNDGSFVKRMGGAYYVVHRADYHRVLMTEAQRVGVVVSTDAEVVNVSFEGKPTVTLHDGRVLLADVVVGADGLWSTMREQLLGRPCPPEETGDLAYRGTFSLAQLESLHDPGVQELIDTMSPQVYMGPNRHCVFYPLKNKTEFNLVLLRPDNLPAGARTAEGELSEMRETFHGWDSTLQKLVSCMSSCLKWKLMHMTELETWVRGSVVLLGDSCHPSLPYQAQGAAMAVEDGAVLGTLLTRLHESELPDPSAEHLSAMLRLYETLRKSRTTLQVQGAIKNRE